MEITTREFKRCVVVGASGRVDSSTAPELADALDELTEAGNFNIVFDMEEVDFISSAGLRVMIDVQKRCQRLNRGKMVLANVPDQIYEALDLAGFIPLFDIFDDLTAAVGSF